MTSLYLSLLLGLLLLIVPGYMIYVYDRLTWRQTVLAVVRMLVQLTAMGALLWAVYHFDRVWLCLLWLLLLVVAASFLMVSRSRLRSGILYLPVAVAMFVSVLAVSLYIVYVVFGASFVASWFVPVSGVLMAHVLATNIPAVSTYFDALRQDSQPYLTLLGNGASRAKALAPYITRALRALTVPAIANLSAMGLFVLPMLLWRTTVTPTTCRYLPRPATVIPISHTTNLLPDRKQRSAPEDGISDASPFKSDSR